MRSLYFVKLRKERAASSKEAIRKAHRELDQHSFCEQGRYFGSGKCDWYVVGGRWSGVLQLAQLGSSFRDALPDFLRPDNELGYAPAFVKQHDAEFQALWDKLGGVGRHPYGRDEFADDGSPDDAAAITPEVLSMFRTNSGYEDVQVFDADNREEGSVKNLMDDCLGDWLVVIDYHL